MSLGKIVSGTALTLLFCASCADADVGRVFKNSLAATAESACRSASNCSTGMRRDPLSEPPLWEKATGRPKDTPFRLPPPN